LQRAAREGREPERLTVMPADVTEQPPLPRRRRIDRFAAASTAGAIVLAASLGVACSDDADRSNAAYCAAVSEHLVLVATPSIATPDDITATIGAYRDIVGHAPAAIEPEWQQLVDALEAASSVDPADPASVASVTDTALRTAPAAVRIQQFTQQTCTLDIGTPPPPTNPVTATAPDTAPGTSGG
jgi:hypothetical protein